MAWITTQIVMKKERGGYGDWEYYIYKRYHFLNWFKFDWFVAWEDSEYSAIELVKRMKDPKVAWEKIID